MRFGRFSKIVLPAALAAGWVAAGARARLFAWIAPVPPPPPPTRSGPPPKRGKAGLHITGGKVTSFPYTRSDGAGYRWDIQPYGTVGVGTDRAYSGGLYLYVNSSRLSFSGQGRLNAAGDEVELGPRVAGGLRVSRRIKVYSDRGLARWLDIFENPTSQSISVKIRLYSDMITTVGRTIYSSGGGGFTDKDTAFVTVTRYPNAPALMHYVCTKRSKVRPTVTVQSDDIYVYFTLTVPAKKTFVLCSFESQNRSAAVLTKQMAEFRPRGALRDLPSWVRRLVVNMPGAGSLGDVDLERSDASDVVHNEHGDPIFGTIANEHFRLETLFGPMDLPAEKVIGLAAGGGQGRRFRVLLAGGQVLAGRMPRQAAVHLELPSGDTLKVPFQAVRQCAYRVSKAKPAEATFAGPVVVLRTGDRVAFEPDSAKLKLRTRHDLVDLDPEDLLAITMDNPGNAVHRATFLNGSRLAGFLEPERIALTLTLGPKLTIPRHLVAEMVFAEEGRPDKTLDSVVLSNGDELFGRLAQESLTVRTKYGQVKLRPTSIRAVSFSDTHLGRVALTLWDGSVLRGQFTRQTLTFQILPGPELDLYVGQCARIRRSQALPPEKVRQRLQRLIGQLGAESYEDRQAATEALVKMGKGIVPMLRKHLESGDPEVRQRIADVIERLKAQRSPPPAPPAPPVLRW